VTQNTEVAGAVADRGESIVRHAERFEQQRVPVRLARHGELRARCGRRVGGKAVAELLAEPRVHRAQPQRAGVASVGHRLLVLEQPCELARREVRIEGHAAALAHLLRAPVRLEPVESLLRPLVLPGHDRRERLAGLGVPRQDRLALVVEPAGNDVAVSRAEQLADRLDHSSEHIFGPLLDPARLGMLKRFLPTRLSDRPQVRVVKHRFDGRRALVDAEQKFFSHSY
jgi:hypothetical protein